MSITSTNHQHLSVCAFKCRNLGLRVSLITIFLFAFCLPLIAQTAESSPSKPPVCSTKAVIAFRWDSDVIDWNYFDNIRTRGDLDRLFTNSKILSRIDSVVFTAAASPEGNYNYNQRLSERRLNTLVSYVTASYPLLRQDQLRCYALGADWEGLRAMVQADSLVPFRSEVLGLLDSPKTWDEKDHLLRNMHDGRVYKYLQVHTLRHLRAGMALALYYPEELQSLIDAQLSGDSMPEVEPVPQADLEIAITTPPQPEPEPEPVLEADTYRFIRPVAIKSNLLFDVASLFNVEVEVPIGKRFSVLAEWVFPWWGGLGNRGGVSPIFYSEKLTMQMLSGGIEGRYWFPRGKRLDKKARAWGDYNPLNGWFVGVYGGAGLYDIQMRGKGAQGEFFVNAGLTVGYAHPIARAFHMEYSIGIGYLSTQYYKYTGVGNDKVVNLLPNGNYERERSNWIGPTKAKISLVWIPRFKVKNRR